MLSFARLAVHGVALGLALGLGGEALGALPELTEADKRAIGERVARIVKPQKQLDIPDGDTIFLQLSTTAEAPISSKSIHDYEGLVTAVLESPSSIVVHPRLDDVRFLPVGDKTEVQMRARLHVEPGAQRGGKVRFVAKVLERRGVGNEIAELRVEFVANVVPNRPSPSDLAADFRAYRIYRRLTEVRRERLASYGLPGLKLGDQEPLPALLKFNADVAKEVFEFERWRARFAIARRHLKAASLVADKAISQLAAKYLALLDVPESELKDLPDVPIVPVEPTKEAAVAALPEAKPEEKKFVGGVEEVTPLEEGEKKPEEAQPKPEPVKPTPTPKVVEPAKPKKVDPREKRLLADEDFEVEAGVRRRETILPMIPRPLVLDDPNLSHSVGFDLSYRQVSDRETADTPSAFFSAQVAATDTVGFEVVMPVAFVNLHVDRTRPIFALGNPLFAAKVRIHLPEVLGNRPVLTPKLRYGLPLAPPQSIPPTKLDADLFTSAAHFTDPFAFMLEKHDIGAGLVASWEWQMFQFSAQAYFDYFVSVAGSARPNDFLTSSYGFSVGARPLFPWLGFYAEGRGTTWFFGPRRSEFFTYLGARARFLEVLEPSLWVAVPIGTISSASPVHVGVGLRFVLDVNAVEVRGEGRGGDVL